MKTSTFTVNDIGDPEPVIATITCRSIVIGEDPSVTGWPTTDYKVKGMDHGSLFVQCAMGVRFEFKRMSSQAGFQPGQIVGYVETLSGSTTFQKVEE